MKALIWALHHNISITGTLVFLKHDSGIAIQYAYSWNDTVMHSAPPPLIFSHIQYVVANFSRTEIWCEKLKL